MFKTTDCLLVMGRRGCGKSYLAQNLQKMWPRRIILDTLNEYSEGHIVYNFDEFCNALINVKNSESFVLIYHFDPESKINDIEFDQIMRLCYYFGNVQIVIEECQIFSTVHNMPHWLKQCLLTGRHQNLSLLFTTQRPGELNKTILSQCSHIFCGQIIEGNDLRYISGFLRQDAEKLVKIPAREFLYFSSEGIKQIKNDFSSIS